MNVSAAARPVAVPRESLPAPSRPDTRERLLAFAFATSVTPGPNVVMVTASAANHGARATVPHVAGISIGFPVMVLLVGLGLAGPFAASPQLHTVLKWIGAAWIVWLAWKMTLFVFGSGQKSPTLGLEMGWIYVAPLVGFGLLVLR